MTQQPRKAPVLGNTDANEALRYTNKELERLGRDEPKDAIFLRELHREPTKLTSGMVVLADGTDWNPGSGAGYYGYYGSAWHKLG